MKKIILIICLLFSTVISFGQYGGATPTSQTRVASDTTQFKINIPPGTTVYCVSNETYYYCKTGTPRTGSLAANPDNFVAVSKVSHVHTEYLNIDSARYQIIEQYSETTNGAQGVIHNCLARPLAGSLKVEVNGQTLRAAQYILTLHAYPTASTVRVNIPVYQYDQVVLDYSYTPSSGHTPDDNEKTTDSEIGLNN